MDGDGARDGGELWHGRNAGEEGADGDNVGERRLRGYLLTPKRGGGYEQTLKAGMDEVWVGGASGGASGEGVVGCGRSIRSSAESVDRVWMGEGILKEDALALVKDTMTDVEGSGVRIRGEVGKGGLKVPEGEESDVDRLGASSEDEAFQGA